MSEEIVVYAADHEGFEVPEPDHRWGDLITEEWFYLWTDRKWREHVRAELHIPALRRLFTYKDQWHMINDQLDTQPVMVLGSQEQDVANPLFAQLRQLEKTIVALEKEFGLTLRAAALINLELGEGERTWAKLQTERRAELRAAAKAKEVGSGKKTKKDELPVAPE